jgi:PAS domain S-box-containing protein
MKYEDWSRDALIARLHALEAERRAAGSQRGLLHDLHVHQLELELQNAALRDVQRALEASHGKYSDLFDLAPIAYVTLDSKGVVIEANLSAAALFGFQRELLIGKPLIALARFDEPTIWWSHLRRCLATREPVTSELRFATARGIQEVQATSVSVAGADGTPSAARTALRTPNATSSEPVHPRPSCASASRTLRWRIS